MIVFVFDSRLGIPVPDIKVTWDELTSSEQEEIMNKWEEVRGDIPDRIKEIEQEINTLQKKLYEEEEFQKSCELNSSIAELASIINDLWIWYRAGESVKVKMHA
ncbi:hypothetical protein [Evansella cellulosilytica]|uniref:Uncharacterized protein n=1 Tax=Evansella cellulosilytica (strain ATCC 21833 / DSM 2522 / FERM P-1141 / JCM 9156 / N-4) TaxID=649639 RepID=E6U139_EVAC2|nr:hypothetical protein [Evansella cellulosilytica]ADU31485.1 hypothetical protein Bcell_3243 [Evansella cellulosilytica DSM 2522]